jgi:hypothetical protein
MSDSTYALQAFACRLLQVGWCELEFRPRIRWSPGPRYELSAESDVIGELETAVTAFLQEAADWETVWHGRVGTDTVRVQQEASRLRIVISSWYPPRRRKTTEQRDLPPWIFEVSTRHFAKQLRHQLTLLLEQWGADGYQSRWTFPFPAQAYRTLGELLDTRPDQATP